MQSVKKKIKAVAATRKGRIWLGVISGVLIAGITGGFLFWQIHKKRIIRQKMQTVVAEKSDSLYSISYESMELDEIRGYLSVTNLRLDYDNTRFASMTGKQSAPPLLLRMQIPFIKVSGVQTPRALLAKEIQGEKVELQNPSIELIYTGEGKDSSRHTPTREIYKQILGNLNLINIDTVLISGADLKTGNLDSPGQKLGLELKNFSIELRNVRVDSAASADTTRLLFAKEVRVECENINWMSQDQRYRYDANKLTLNSVAGIVHINNFIVAPQLNENAFVKSLPTQTDRFDFLIEDITMLNLDYLRLPNEDITADSIFIASASFKIYRDLNIPRDHRNRVGTYPQQAIAKIPIPLHIKKIVVKNALVEYKEKNNITQQAGTVRFSHVSATISNITNKKELITRDNRMTADINSLFLDKTPFAVSWSFDLLQPHGQFDLNGSLGSMKAPALNELTMPMGPARMDDGSIKSVFFNFSGNDFFLSGSVKLLYEDLKVSLLKKKDNSRELDKKGLASFAANLLIKNDNPSGKKPEPRIANIKMERNTNRSIFNLAWKTLFKGIKETVGISSK